MIFGDFVGKQFYKFLGYYTSNISWENAGSYELIGVGTEIATVTNGITYYGIWEPKEVEVRYDKNDAIAAGSMTGQNTRFGFSIILNTNGYSLTDHTFKGWVTTSGGAATINNASNISLNIGLLENAVAQGDKYILTLYAVWERVPVQIDFDYNGGSGNIHSKQYGKGMYGLLPDSNETNAYKQYYVLSGWSTEPDGGTVYATGDLYLASTPTTLYAVWSRLQVEIEFLPGDGISDGSFTTVEVDAGKDYVLPTDGFTANNTEYVLLAFSPNPTADPDDMILYRIGDPIFVGENAITLTAIYGEDMPPKGTPLANFTWEEINQISESGLAAEYFNLGDEKDVTLTTGEVITMQIWGFDHDDKTDYSGKAGITFGMKELMATKKRMYDSNNEVDWEASEMRYTTIKAILGTVPEDLMGYLKTVKKLIRKNRSSYEAKSTADKLFLFSYVEIGGSTSNDYKMEGNQYAYWLGKLEGDRIKRLSNGSGDVSTWWLRTNSNYRSFLVYRNNGTTLSEDPIYSHGICFGFCI